MCYNQHNAEAAARKYMLPNYIQHNPEMGNGQDAFIKYFNDYMKKAPNLKATIYRIVAENDLVVTHIGATMNENEPGIAMIDIFRMEGDMVAEHWIVSQQIPEKSENNNGMF